MKNQEKRFTQEELNETPVTAEELLGEIEPLLCDYFVGEFTRTKEGIEYFLPNGQKLILAVREG